MTYFLGCRYRDWSFLRLPRILRALPLKVLARLQKLVLNCNSCAEGCFGKKLLEGGLRIQDPALCGLKKNAQGPSAGDAASLGFRSSPLLVNQQELCPFLFGEQDGFPFTAAQL